MNRTPYIGNTAPMNDATPEACLAKLPEILKRDMDCNLCVCNEVRRRDVIEAIANGARALATHL